MTLRGIPPDLGTPANPIIVYSEASANCTHKCFFCGQSRVNRSGFLREDVDRRVGELLRANPEKRFLVYNHVVGEPLLNPRLERRLPTILLPNTEVWLCTNGVLLDQARIDSLLEAGLQNIWFTLFGSTREEYKSYAGVDLFEKAYAHLEGLVGSLHRFRCAQLICFSKTAPPVFEKVKDMKNVLRELSRRIEPWDLDQPSRIRFLCISINGEIAYDWKDSNFTTSPGNILTMSDEEIMNGYYASWADCGPR